MKKIIIFLGTRPEVIKLAPIIMELRKYKKFDVTVCSTGQHTDLFKNTLEVFNLKIDFNLKVMQPGQSLGSLTGKIISGIEKVIDQVSPDIAIVHGDTTTCFAAALSCYYKKVQIAHVEAGLRTFDLLSPYPEEGNRQLVGVLADFHFCPTEQNKLALINSGVCKKKVFVTGNTVIDALLSIAKLNDSDKNWSEKLECIHPFLKSSKPFILITAHRRESFGYGFNEICKAIKELSLRFPNINFIYPVHPNPKVKEVVYSSLENINNIYLIKPLEYRAFVYAMQKAILIITDSGGIQEEAPSLGKPVLVIREKTERIEAVKAGTVKLIGTNSEKIQKEVISIIEDQEIYRNMSESNNPYGSGNASNIICEILNEYLNDKKN